MDLRDRGDLLGVAGHARAGAEGLLDLAGDRLPTVSAIERTRARRSSTASSPSVWSTGWRGGASVTELPPQPGEARASPRADRDDDRGRRSPRSHVYRDRSRRGRAACAPHARRRSNRLRRGRHRQRLREAHRRARRRAPRRSPTIGTGRHRSARRRPGGTHCAAHRALRSPCRPVAPSPEPRRRTGARAAAPAAPMSPTPADRGARGRSRRR